MQSLDTLPRPTKAYHSHAYDRLSPSKSKFDGKGKTVLVTGGSEGIGLSIARSFAEAGTSSIIIASRSAEKQAEAKKALEADFPNTEFQTIAASITDLPRVSEIMRSLGDLDIVVLNAAISHKQVPSVGVSLEDIEKTFHGNVIAPLHMVKEYLALPMPQSGSKTIVNISSAASHALVPGQIGYGPSKAAFVNILQHMSREYTPEKDGVRFFSVHPGVFLTTLAKDAGVPENAFAWEDIQVPGHFTVWLAGPESDFLHGKFVWAQWDVDELIEQKEKIEKVEKVEFLPSFLQLGLQL